MKEQEGTSRLELRRELGLFAAVAVGVASIIGSGIFKKPALMASQLGSAELLILVWVVAGIMTLLGALSIAEISGMFQDPGGQYVYFNKGFNKFIGYLYGWAVFIVIQTGATAALAFVFADSLGYFLKLPRLSGAWESFSIPIPFIGAMTPFKFIGQKLCAIALIMFLMTVNYLGVKFGSAIGVVFSALKITIIAGIIILAFAFGHGSLANFTESGPLIAAGSSSVFFLFIMAMAGAFWAYDGWIMLTYLSGEIKNVQKNLPRALAITVVIIIALYVLMNLAYIYIIPVSTMARNYSEGYLVAVDVANRFLGDWGGGLIAIAIMISTFGAVNGTTMMPARITFAMAREKVFFRRLGDVHPRYRTPGKSLIVLGIWTSILVLTGTFDQLTNTMVFVSWIFYALASISVFTLRKKMPDTPRPYKVWGYPVTPIVFILFASVYIVFTLYSDIVSFRNGTTPIINSVMGLFWLAIGIPGYFYWSRKQKRERN